MHNHEWHGYQMESSSRYLGHMITDVFHDNKDLKWQLSFFMVNQICYWVHSITVQPMWKKQLFSSYHDSLYICLSWCMYTVWQWRQMHITYNNVFTKLMVYNFVVQVECCGKQDWIFLCTDKMAGLWFISQLMCSENSFANCVMNSSACLSSNLHRNWNKCLYVSEMVF